MHKSITKCQNSKFKGNPKFKYQDLLKTNRFGIELFDIDLTFGF